MSDPPKPLRPAGDTGADAGHVRGTGDASAVGAVWGTGDAGVGIGRGRSGVSASSGLVSGVAGKGKKKKKKGKRRGAGSRLESSRLAHSQTSASASASGFDDDSMGSAELPGSLAGSSSAAFSESAGGGGRHSPQSGHPPGNGDGSGSRGAGSGRGGGAGNGAGTSSSHRDSEFALRTLASSGHGMSSKHAAQLLVWSLRHAAARIRGGTSAGSGGGGGDPSGAASSGTPLARAARAQRAARASRGTRCCASCRQSPCGRRMAAICPGCGTQRTNAASAGATTRPPASVFLLYAGSVDGASALVCACALLAVWLSSGRDGWQFPAVAAVLLVAVALNCALVWRRQAVLRREVVGRVLAAAKVFEQRVLHVRGWCRVG